MKVLIFCALTAIIQLTAAQDKVWNLELCKTRSNHFQFQGRQYLFSGLEKDLNKQVKTVTTGDAQAEFTGVAWDFEKAGNYCRARCMDLVSFETEAEWLFIRDKMEELKAPFIWTSGHICDETISDRCLTDPALQPRLVYGWFWSGSGEKIHPTNQTPPGWKTNPWGSTGIYTKVNQQKDPKAPAVPQPDNGEQTLGLLEKKEESCLAVATNLWQPETVWNDIACYHEKAWICEDNERLLTEAGLN